MSRRRDLWMGMLAVLSLANAPATAAPPLLNQAVEVVGAGAVADPLIAVEANRAAIVNRLATEFGEAAVQAGVNQETFRGVLLALRADQLLAAALVGSFAELTAIVMHAPSDGALLQRYVALTPMVPQSLSALPFAQAYLTRDGDTLTVTRAQELRLGETYVVGYFVAGSPIVSGGGLITPKDGPGSGANSWIGYTGGSNVASGSGSAVAAGTFNAATGVSSMVVGGSNNTANGISSLVIGGFDNHATAIDAIVGAGAGSRATGARSVVVGGGYNLASGQWSFIGGGGRNGVAATPAGTNALDNIASGNFSVVTGGQGNAATGNFAAVPGGTTNLASGVGSFAAGTRAKTQTAGGSPVIHNGTFAFADSSAFDFNTAAANEFGVRATGGMRFVTAIDGAGAPTKTSTLDSTGTLGVPGNLNLLPSTSTGVGNITKNGFHFIHNFGNENTFIGDNAGNLSMTGSANTGSGFGTLAQTSTGHNNTATGALALVNNTAGNNNTATGQMALALNTTGSDNTASGVGALFQSNSGSENTAIGSGALNANASGIGNTASGFQALFQNTSGGHNTANGYHALYSNTSGSYNVALGDGALGVNTTGDTNIAIGRSALVLNTAGSFNTATGPSALYANTTGIHNTANGTLALSGNTTGSYNVAIGILAGSNLSTGDYNIDIGSPGISGEANTIRIGDANQTRAFIAGIRGVATDFNNAVTVVIDSFGQLGTISSSRRFKDDIADMNDASSSLMKLRPVTFHYKADRDANGRALHYGLIAEEVATVYPGMVAHSADGQIETVMYQFLAPMLLNEYQKQQRVIGSQTRELAALKKDHAMQAAEIAELKQARAVQAAELASLRRSVEVLLVRGPTNGALAAAR